MKIKSRALILFLISSYTYLFIPLTPLWAQSLGLLAEADQIPPTIRHEPPALIPLGESFFLDAVVSDNQDVKEVLLFYRTFGDKNYLSLTMEAIGEGRYRGLLPSKEIREPGLEYYIRATDPEGNMALQGLPFSPLEAIVSAASPEGEQENLTERVFPQQERELGLKTEEAPAKPWYKKWWVWTIAGAVVIGAAAASGGGGGGGGGKDPSTAPVAVTATAP